MAMSFERFGLSSQVHRQVVGATAHVLFVCFQVLKQVVPTSVLLQEQVVLVVP